MEGCRKPFQGRCRTPKPKAQPKIKCNAPAEHIFHLARGKVKTAKASNLPQDAIKLGGTVRVAVRSA